MSFVTLLSQFKYPALIIGLLLEGESVLVLAAFMAHGGYFQLPWVILIGFAVTFASDQFFFWLGRTKGNQILEGKSFWKPNLEKVRSLLGRNTTLLFLGFRFIYGLRTVLPFVFGISKLDPKRFVLLDLIGALIWAVIFGVAGYLFGQLLANVFKNIKQYEPWIVLGIIVILAGVWLFRRITCRTKKDS